MSFADDLRSRNQIPSHVRYQASSIATSFRVYCSSVADKGHKSCTQVAEDSESDLVTFETIERAETVKSLVLEDLNKSGFNTLTIQIYKDGPFYHYRDTIWGQKKDKNNPYYIIRMKISASW